MLKFVIGWSRKGKNSSRLEDSLENFVLKLLLNLKKFANQLVSQRFATTTPFELNNSLSNELKQTFSKQIVSNG